jgi:myo-inositol-1(or 4)-monophosphatase
VSALDLVALRAAAEAAARAGGEVILASFEAPPNVREKSQGDWVTDADMESERTVRRVLEDLAPGIPVHGEEEGGDRDAALHWLVDPLDGTANFVHGHPAVGCSVGLVADGRPVVGVVHAPMLHQTFSAALGAGATRNGAPLAVRSSSPEARSNASRACSASSRRGGDRQRRVLAGSTRAAVSEGVTRAVWR